MRPTPSGGSGPRVVSIPQNLPIGRCSMGKRRFREQSMCGTHFAPLKFKMHAWLALRRRCWTADHRRRRGLPTHIMCPLCGTQKETLDHLTLQCPYARAVWTGVITRHNLPDIVPSENAEIGEWWPAAIAMFVATDRKTANSLIMLVMRTLWLERNAHVFEHSPITAQVTLRLMLDEWHAWMMCRRGTRRDPE
jgi:hypothetical protein